MFSTKDLANSLGVDEIQNWQDSKKWRGFDGKLLHEIGGQFVIDRRTDEPHLMCVVKIHNKIVGGLKAILEKKYKKQIAYITSPGTWVKDKGIFPFDHVKKMVKLKGFRFIILVEGPRDALRLIAEGLPAVAILGANNISKKKLNTILSIGNIQQIITMPDNDAGGTLMHKLIKSELLELGIKPQRFNLTKDKDKKGELIKMDPCSAPLSEIKRFKKILKEKGLL
jgi:DNA primase